MSNIFIKYANIQMLNFFFYCKYSNFFFIDAIFARKNTIKKRETSFKFFLKSIFRFSSWLKARILYYANNWIYTTNHKRIAVNYFWFVILSGIFGMVLATVIRLELAYPGVGIFAGDSLQYLSLATAHGVIMVFFMIIPLLSGAFANFLLPTQLGVHDVAFPRLNSAAFWFLPGGLVMLGQLICLDRRYQRMNCFNIREVQSLLKRRFFTDLITSNDHHELLNQTMIGLRFKTNDIQTINSHIMLHNTFGLTLTQKIRDSVFCETDQFNNLIFLNLNSYLFKILQQTKYWLPNFITKNFSINHFNFAIGDFFLFKDIMYLFVCSQTLITSFYDAIINFYFFITNTISTFKPIIISLLTSLSTIFFDQIENPFVRLSLRTYRFTDNAEENINIFINSTLNKIEFFYDNTFVSIPSFSEIIIIIRDCILNIDPNYFAFEDLKFIIYTCADLFKDAYIACIVRINWLYNIYIRFLHDLNLAFKNSYLYKSVSYVWSTPSRLISAIINSEWFNRPWLISNISVTTKGLYGPLSITWTWNQEVALNWYKFFENLYNQFIYFSVTYHIFAPLDIYIIIDYCGIAINLSRQLFTFVKDGLERAPEPFNIFILHRKLSDFVSSWYFPTIFSTDNFINLFNTFLILLKSANAIFKNLLINIHQNFSNYRNDYDLLINQNFRIKDFVPFLNRCFWFVTYNLWVAQHFLSLLYNNFVRIIISFEHNFTNLNFNNTRSFILNIFKNSNSSIHVENIEDSVQKKYENEETTNQPRSIRFNNPIFRYDYKVGDYFPKFYQETFTFMLPTYANVTGGIRTSPWFLALASKDAFILNCANFFDTSIIFNKKLNYTIFEKPLNRSSNTDAFYNLFRLVGIPNKFNNMYWTSFSTLNEKFSHMFTTHSMQQRIYSNWRQLKFTREAWRCKLLSARHQKSLFRRYANENGVFWSIEKNARDLLPGWAMITPFSSRTRFTAIGKVDIGVSAILLVLISSIISGANFLVTYRYLSTLNNRKMRDARSFFTEGIMCASWMMIAANPMLIIGLIMLLCDRHWQTSFFDYSGGGDTILFQHMFWFFGHPEVYIVIIPTFGFVNTLFSYYLKKRISARASLLYSIYTIAFLGFFVWGHHMYMVGLSHTTRMLFSTLTVMISVPAATKLMHWCVTLVNSSFTVELPFLFMLTYVFLFVSGGISGMCVAHTGMDVLFHDTFYVIGHFHVMFAGAAMFGSFGAFYFYFSAIFGVKYSRVYAYLHFTYYLLGQLLTVIPMFWLGYAGMPRRVLDYPSAFGGWHSVITAGHMLSVAGLIAFFMMLFDSLRQAKAATRNNFGIMRYNTRINFYLYEIARILFTQRKGSHLYRYFRPTSFKLNGYHYSNYEYLETTLYSYTFVKKK